MNYQIISSDSLAPASGTSKVVGIVQDLIPLDGGMYVDAYHAWDFSTNILQIDMLSELFNFLFTADPSAINGIISCIFNSADLALLSFGVKLKTGCIYSTCMVQNTRPA